MFGSMRKAMVVGAVVAVGAFAVPAAASAAEWTLDGNPIVGSESVTAEGALTIVPAGSALRMTCNASLDVALGEDAAVQVDDAYFSDCSTNLPGCTLDLHARSFAPFVSSLPWLGVGDESTMGVAIDDVSWMRKFSLGCPSPLTGAYFSESGDVVPVFDAVNQRLWFDGTGATGTLTSPIGTAYLDGGLDVLADGTLDLS